MTICHIKTAGELIKHRAEVKKNAPLSQGMNVLLDGNRFSQVTRLIHVGAFNQRHMISQQL